MKKRLEKALQPGNVLFYVLFLLFAVGSLYYSVPYGLIGVALCVMLRVISLRSESERKQRLQGLMKNIEIEGGEVRPAVTKSRCLPLSRWRRPARSSGRTMHLPKSAGSLPARAICG